MLGQGFLGERIELPGCRVGFNLPVTSGVVILDEPLTEPRERSIIQALDLPLDLFDLAHTIPPVEAIPPQTGRVAERLRLSGRVFQAVRFTPLFDRDLRLSRIVTT